MKRYTVLFAQDVPHYGTVSLEAENDADALEQARAYWDRVKSGDEEWPLFNAEFENALLDRIVEITEDNEDYREVARDVPLDNYYLAHTPTALSRGQVTAATAMFEALAWIACYDSDRLDDAAMREALCDAVGTARTALAIVKGRAGE